jgi:hypothetical protein
VAKNLQVGGQGAPIGELKDYARLISFELLWRLGRLAGAANACPSLGDVLPPTAKFARIAARRLATIFPIGSSPIMADGQLQFYEEQAELCERGAASTQDPVEQQTLLKRRDTWRALAKMIAPRRFGPGLRNFDPPADVAR